MTYRRHRPLISVPLYVLIGLAVSACASHVVDTSSERVTPAPTVASLPQDHGADVPDRLEVRFHGDSEVSFRQVKHVRQAVILPERYLSHIALLAHDELKGRGTGSHGIDLAAGYIAGQFAAAGLLPGGPDGTYFQEFTIPRGGRLLDETELVIEGAEIDAAMHSDFIPFGFSAEGNFEGEAVFAGYGITSTDRNYDDYAGIDVEGKVLLMLRREPPGFDTDGYTDHARFDSKLRLAAEHGAVAVLIANQDPGEDGIDGLMRFRLQDKHEDIPALHVKRDLADKLLAAGSARSLTDLQRQLDETGRNASIELSGVRVSGTVACKSEEILARNVIGVLPGTGPNASEYVVIGAHYDHLGVRHGRIFNGADDNASGTAGVVELAHALAAAPYRDRSVILMTFSGEEIGLHGSAHFVSDPTVPIDSIVAMLNMDMIGRLSHDDEGNMLAVQGVGTGASFDEIVSRHAEEIGIEYLSDEGVAEASDHTPFYQAGIPALFFFTGVHVDYHQPSDDTEKINAAGAARVVQLVYEVAKDIINGEAAPQYVYVDKPARILRGAGPSGGVVMGIVPDTQDESVAKGWRVIHVLPDRGAAKAGMQDGDRIIAIDGQPINDLSDYRAVTADRKPGDVVEVTILRAGKELRLQVELTARGRRR